MEIAETARITGPRKCSSTVLCAPVRDNLPHDIMMWNTDKTRAWIPGCILKFKSLCTLQKSCKTDGINSSILSENVGFKALQKERLFLWPCRAQIWEICLQFLIYFTFSNHFILLCLNRINWDSWPAPASVHTAGIAMTTHIFVFFKLYFPDNIFFQVGLD